VSPSAPNVVVSAVTRLLDEEAFFYFRGRVALFAVMDALKVGPGDEVVIQGFTCLAVLAPILARGATPVYVDVDAESLNVSAANLRTAIAPRTRLVIIQHSFGIPADLEPLIAIARNHGLFVVEDCAHTLESSYKGREVGSFGDAAIYSFEWGKPVTIGLGGALLLNNDRIRNRIREHALALTSPGVAERRLIDAEYAAFQLVQGSPLYWGVRESYRYLARLGVIVGSFRPEELNGSASPDYHKGMARSHRARLERKLQAIADDTSRRDALASEYRTRLDSVGLHTPQPAYPHRSVLVKFPFFVQNKMELLSLAARNHIELYDMFATVVHPVPMAELWRVGYKLGDCPKAEELAETVVSLPMHRKTNRASVDRSIKFLAKYARPARHD
jgi:perosamine synthetase